MPREESARSHDVPLHTVATSQIVVGKFGGDPNIACASRTQDLHERTDTALTLLCAVLTEQDATPVTIIARPKRDHGPGGCSAILQRGTSRVAVGHTCVHAKSEKLLFPFMWSQIAPALTDRLRSRFPDDWLRLWLPVHQLPPREEWTTMIEHVSAAVTERVPTMPLDSEGGVNVPRFGFQVLVGRLKPYGRGLCSMAWTIRGRKDDDSIEDIRRAIRGERKKLLANGVRGDQTILLLDAEEYGWPVQFTEELSEAARTETLEAFDAVYVTCTVARPTVLFPFTAGGGEPFSDASACPGIVVAGQG